MQRYRNKYTLESPKPPIPIFHIQNNFISKNKSIITTEKVSKIGSALKGKKNRQTIIGKNKIPIILSNKKEKYTPNFANEFNKKICPKRRITIVFNKKKIIIITPVFQKSIGHKLVP